jgi:hypothetical protein
MAMAAAGDGPLHSKLKLHHLKTKPNDWIYLSEGKVNAVFAYSVSSRCCKTDYQGYILRIAKRDFMRALSLPEYNDNANDSTVESNVEEDDECNLDYFRAAQDIEYIARLLRPTLGEQYVDLPMVTCLPAFFLQKLHKICLQQGCIPKSRLEKEWEPFLGGSEECLRHIHKDALKPKSFVATIHRNYTLFDYSSLPLQPRFGTPCSICVEIKPKAGYLSRSPLVRKDHRAKFYSHRYGIMQHLMVSGLLVKGWGEDLPKVSSYSPLDLFSGDRLRIQSALIELFRHPQNNLRLFCNGALVLSYDKTPSEEELDHIISAMLASDKERQGSSRVHQLDAFIQKIVCLLSRVFLAEPFLFNLLSIQQNFDLIDADGAVEVYTRLVELCGGSFEKAEELIDNYPFDERHFSRGAYDYFPVTKPKCSALDALCSELYKFNNIIKNGPTTTDILDESFTLATEKVNNLSKEGCIWLLQQWILSLCACDLSLMICFDNFRSLPSNHLHSFSGSLQEVSKAGSLLLHNEDTSWTSLSYSLKAADTDPKPAEKLRTRRQKEHIFCLSQRIPNSNQASVSGLRKCNENV